MIHLLKYQDKVIPYPYKTTWFDKGDRGFPDGWRAASDYVAPIRIEFTNNT